MPAYTLEGFTPVVHPDAYVHDTAVLIGDVIVGPGVYVGPCASLRGDFGRIVIEQGANIQDTCVLHSAPDQDCIVEADGHIGHGAVVHCCHIGRNGLVGMNAVVMDYARIGAESIVGACSFVPARFECERRSMVLGSPARVRRTLSDEDFAWKNGATAYYHALARRCLASMEVAEPLTAVEPDRPYGFDIGIERGKH
jgi:phenylacetic acid degradation protein